VLVDVSTNFSENSEIVVPNVNEVVLRNGHACATGVGENLLLVLQKGLFVLIGELPLGSLTEKSLLAVKFDLS
jgi:hypothetical protein